jgi:uncharacterized repeat protein (TIGR03803 family)
MRNKRLSLSFTVALVIAASSLVATSTLAFAQRVKVLHNFGSSIADGTDPYGGLVFDAAGNLYGTTTYGGGLGCGEIGCGIVFQLAPQTDGSWRETIIHNFNSHPSDGQQPYASMIFDSVGNLYGTTRSGGPHNCGTAFKLTPQGGTSWVEQILYAFRPGGACFISGGLVFDAAGNLYGTSEEGGLYGWGAVYELSPTAAGQWTQEVLHSFGSIPDDGNTPFGSLVFDASGNLYGTTENGFGQNFDDGGTVYELLPQPDGTWKENLIAAFPSKGSGPKNPFAAPVFDSAGNLYATSNLGGTSDEGTVFELSPNADGGWTPKILFSFGNTPVDGTLPYSNLVFDASGNLYGTTSGSTVFKLTPQSGGTWSATNYSLSSKRAYINAGVILDSSGNIYGTAAGGGAFLFGMVFEITP